MADWENGHFLQGLTLQKMIGELKYEFIEAWYNHFSGKVDYFEELMNTFNLNT